MSAPKTAREAWALIHEAHCEAVSALLQDDDYEGAMRRARLIAECEREIAALYEGEPLEGLREKHARSDR